MALPCQVEYVGKYNAYPTTKPDGFNSATLHRKAGG